MVSGRGISNLGGSQSYRQGTKNFEFTGGSNVFHSFYIYILSLWKTFYNKTPEKNLTCSPNLDTILFLSELLRPARAGRNHGDCSREWTITWHLSRVTVRGSSEKQVSTWSFSPKESVAWVYRRSCLVELNFELVPLQWCCRYEDYTLRYEFDVNIN